MKIIKFWSKLICLILLAVFFFQPVFAQNTGEIEKKIQDYQSQIDRLSVQAKTLQNQIAQFDTQIKLAELKITQTEEKISLLGGRINQLELSLGALTKSFNSRVVETYKMRRLADPLILILSADNLSQAASRFQYLKKIQEADRDLMQRLQNAKTTYKAQKDQEEILSLELGKQRDNLNSQKRAKANLLIATKNDEKRYQQLLGEAIAQLAIARGMGTETYVRDIAEGEILGSMIESASGCSSGRHLHFEIHKDSGLEDPNIYLRGISIAYSYNSDSYGYFGTVNPRGTWNWPLTEPIVVNQGFGPTGYARDFGYANNIHPGIDIESENSQVKAVKAGKLYRGSISCGGRYPGVLTYAKVEQDSGIVTYYEHIYVK